MVRTNFILEREAEKAAFKKPRAAFSCSRKDRHVLLRDLLTGSVWTVSKKHDSLYTKLSKEPQEPYYEHLRSKAQRRSGCGHVKISGHIKIPRWYFPAEITALREAINKSRSILEEKDDRDDVENVSESTWNRAQSFLMKNALKMWRFHKTCFDPPKIRAVGDGTIDLHWKSPTRELLINVPVGSEEPIGYYGDDRAEGTKDAVRGKDLESSPDAEWIFLWLMQ